MRKLQKVANRLSIPEIRLYALVSCFSAYKYWGSLLELDIVNFYKKEAIL